MGTLAQGFGDIMVEVGLLIGFGVLLGSLLYAMGALQKMVGALLGISSAPGACPTRSAAP